MWMEVLFWLALVVSAAIGFLYFRDLGDVTQMILKVKRQNMVRFIRHECRLLAAASLGFLVAAVLHLGFGAGSGWVFWPAAVVIVVLLGFPWVWVHVGLRNQQNTAQYYPIEEAAEYVSPQASVMVVEKDGVARAHPDAQLMRPHLAGNAAGLAGENVVITYCAMANLGIGYTPVVEVRSSSAFSAAIWRAKNSTRTRRRLQGDRTTASRTCAPRRRRPSRPSS